jgi:hypothetical protein
MLFRTALVPAIRFGLAPSVSLDCDMSVAAFHQRTVWYHKGRKHHKTGQRHHRPEPWNGHGKPWNPWKPPMLHAWWYSAYRTVARCSRYNTSTFLDTFSKLQ